MSVSIVLAFVVHDTRTVPYSAWGRKTRREGGGLYSRARGSLLNRECWGSHALFRSVPSPGSTAPPPAGSPKNHSPRRGPTILGGTFGARVRATSLPRKIPRQIMPLAAMRPARRANSGRAAAYFVSSARHSPGRRLLRLHAPKECSSCLRTLRIGGGKVSGRRDGGARDRFRGTREGERMPRYTGVRVPFYVYYILCSGQT